MTALDKAIQEIKEVREQEARKEFTQKEVDEFEDETRKNADAIREFCRNQGMSPIQAGAACDWLVQCIKAAIAHHED